MINVAMKGLAQAERKLARMARVLPSAQARALNRTATTVKKLMSDEMRKEFNVPARYAKRSVKSNRANRRILRVDIVAASGQIPLIHYGARPKKPAGEGARRPKTGVSVLVKKAKGRKTPPGTFIARVPTAKRWSTPGRSGGSVFLASRRDLVDYGAEPGTGHVGVFLRGKKSVKPGDHKGQERLPIHQLYGPSPVYALENAATQQRIQAEANVTLEKRMKHEIRYALKRATGRG